MAYDLPRTTLGRTGLTVTRLGIGGAYCETVEGYRAALDCGVTVSPMPRFTGALGAALVAAEG